MSQFWLYFKLGLEHVLDWQAYDHILFLIALVISYSFSSWKKVLYLATTFTLGHTISLILSAYGVVRVDTKYVEILIAVSILITALYNLFTAKKKEQKNAILLYITTAFFGIIHGLGFSTYFKMIASGMENKFLLLMEFTLGIEAAQITVVISVLILTFLFLKVLKVNRRDWILVISSIVIGILLPILRDNLLKIW